MQVRRVRPPDFPRRIRGQDRRIRHELHEHAIERDRAAPVALRHQSVGLHQQRTQVLWVRFQDAVQRPHHRRHVAQRMTRERKAEPCIRRRASCCRDLLEMTPRRSSIAAIQRAHRRRAERVQVR